MRGPGVTGADVTDPGPGRAQWPRWRPWRRGSFWAPPPPTTRRRPMRTRGPTCGRRRGRAAALGEGTDVRERPQAVRAGPFSRLCGRGRGRPTFPRSDPRWSHWRPATATVTVTTGLGQGRPFPLSQPRCRALLQSPTGRCGRALLSSRPPLHCVSRAGGRARLLPAPGRPGAASRLLSV